MSRKNSSRLFLFLLSSLLILSFQNCSGSFVHSTALSSQSSTSAGNDTPISTPTSPGTPNPISLPPVLPLPGALAPGSTFDLSTLKINSAAELTTLSDCPVGSGLTSGCSAMTDYGSMLYDSSQNRFLMYGGNHGPGKSSSLFTFDLQSQRWSVAYVGTDYSKMYTAAGDVDPTNTDLRCFYKDTGAPIARHTYDMMELVPDLNGKPNLVLVGSGGVDFSSPAGHSGCTIGHYDITDRRWSWTDTKPDQYYYYAGTSAYDPISKMIIVIGNGANVSPTQLFTYDPVTQVVKSRVYFPEFGYDNNLTYFPPTDKFYLITRGAPNKVYEISVDRSDFSKSKSTLLNLSGTPYEDTTVTSGWKYDPDNQVIAGGIKDGRFYYIDLVAKSWGSVPMNIQVGGTSISATAFHNIDYDLKNRMWVFVDNNTKKTWAFRFVK